MVKIVWIFIVSRVWMFFFIGYMKWLFGFPKEMPDQIHLDNPILNVLNLYDSFHYAQIATDGYSQDMLTAFFPLLPLLTRGLMLLGFNVYVAGVLLSNLLFLGCLWAFDQVLKQRKIQGKVRSRILWVLALFPSSYFFSAFYTESLSLLITLLAFYMWGKEKRGCAYILGGVASATRITGIFIPIAFFLERLIQRKVRWQDIGFSFLSFLLFAFYPCFLWVTKGDPLLFVKAQHYFPRKAGFPLESLWVEVQNIWVYKSIQPLVAIHFLILIMVVGYFGWAIRTKQPWADIIFSIGSIALPLSSVATISSHIATHGLIRYILTVFPLFMYWGIKWSEWRGSRLLRVRVCIVLILWAIITGYCYGQLSIKGFLA